ncbi:hypothetical protein [Pelagibius marinus]|uniref:hypothetical protein n=1 Tax=Pelagibius marinus TaxID=2762760 RepID=UPI00187313F4|nr:hypothetical protein [Pelagibius marinus]
MQQQQAEHSAAGKPRRLTMPRSLAAAGLFGLAACAATGSGGGTVYFTNFTAGYVPSSLAASGPLLVETYGAPAPNLAQEAVTAASVQGLRNHGPSWMPRHYSGNPADVERPAYVLRIAYGVPKAFNGQGLCKAEMSSAAVEAARGAGDKDATRTLAGVCRGTKAVAYAEGSPGVSPDISGEGFSKFVGLLGRKLMPRRNPVTQDDCIFRFCD